MENGLAVAADQRDAFWQDTKLTASGKGCVAEKFSQPKIQLAESTCTDGLLLGNAEDFFAKRLRKFDGRVAKKLGIQIRRCA
jgi:hypothetical protein